MSSFIPLSPSVITKIYILNLKIFYTLLFHFLFPYALSNSSKATYKLSKTNIKLVN